MTEVLFQSLVTPFLVLGQLIVGFSWPAAVVVSGFVALAVGAILALNHGTKAPRWIFLPLVLTHGQIFAYGQFATPGWATIVVLTVMAIGWMLWKFRNALVAGLMFAWFALVYGSVTTLYVFARLNASF